MAIRVNKIALAVRYHLLLLGVINIVIIRVLYTICRAEPYIRSNNFAEVSRGCFALHFIHLSESVTNH